MGVPRTLADAMRAQRDALAAELCAGLHVTVVGAEAGPALAAAAAEVTRVGLPELGSVAGSVVYLDDIEPSAAALDLLAGLAAGGRRLIACVAASSTARALAGRIPEAIAIPQHAVEAAWLGDGAAASVEAPDLDPRDALCTIVLAGFDAEAVARAAEGVETAGAPVHLTHLLALEAANTELRNANARLAAERLGSQGSAAASVLARLQARLEAAEQKVLALEHQLAEWQVAARDNDRFHQEARRLLQTPRHRVAESLHHRVRALPGVRQVAAARARLAPPAEEASPPAPPPEAASPPPATPPESGAPGPAPSAAAPGPPPEAAPPAAPARSGPEPAPARTVHGTYVGDGRVFVTTTWGGRLFSSAHDLSITPELLADGTYDVPFTSFALAELRPGDVAVDVGANIGLFTLLMARIVGPGGRVIAYEPEPDNLALLRDNVAFNYLTGWVEIIDRAAAGEAGTATFFATDRFKGNSSLIEHTSDYFTEFGVDASARIEVETERLDDRLADLDRIALLKIDVEGAELGVLQGARGLLEAGVVRRLCVEVLRSRMGSDWEPFVELLRGMESGGWRLSRLDGAGRRVPLPFDELVAVGRFSQVLLEPAGD
jgi:FkbM family methyltransferase